MCWSFSTVFLCPFWRCEVRLSLRGYVQAGIAPVDYKWDDTGRMPHAGEVNHSTFQYSIMKRATAVARSTPGGVALAVAFLTLPLPAHAAPKVFNCTLTQLESFADPNPSQTGHCSIDMTIDEEAKTITVSQDGTTQPLGHVSFWQSTINGYTGNLSVGMDRSSGSIVLQSYSPNSNKVEFGTCRLNEATAPRQ